MDFTVRSVVRDHLIYTVNDWISVYGAGQMDQKIFDRLDVFVGGLVGIHEHNKSMFDIGFTLGLLFVAHAAEEIEAANLIVVAAGRRGVGKVDACVVVVETVLAYEVDAKAGLDRVRRSGVGDSESKRHHDVI